MRSNGKQQQQEKQIIMRDNERDKEYKRERMNVESTNKNSNTKANKTETKKLQHAMYRQEETNEKWNECNVMRG